MTPHLVTALDRLTFRERVIWLAGLFEGEGCFQFRNATMHMHLSMTDRDDVERAHAWLGGTARVTIRPPWGKGKKSQHRSVISGARAAGWAMMMYPFLGERRRAKVREILELWRARRIYTRYRRQCPRGHDLPPSRNGRRVCQLCYQTVFRARARAAYKRKSSAYRASPNQGELAL